MPGVVPDPGSYTATFNTDGSINVKADCNNVNGTYTQTGSSLTISFGVTTLAACPSGSLDFDLPGRPREGGELRHRQ